MVGVVSPPLLARNICWFNTYIRCEWRWEFLLPIAIVGAAIATLTGIWHCVSTMLLKWIAFGNWIKTNWFVLCTSRPIGTKRNVFSGLGMCLWASGHCMCSANVPLCPRSHHCRAADAILYWLLIVMRWYAWKRRTQHTIAWPFIVLSKSTRTHPNGCNCSRISCQSVDRASVHAPRGFKMSEN